MRRLAGLSINLKIYFCGGNAAIFVFPATCAAEKHLVSEKLLNKRFFKGTGVVLAGIERSQKSLIFASGIPVQERVDFSARSRAFAFAKARLAEFSLKPLQPALL